MLVVVVVEKTSSLVQGNRHRHVLSSSKRLGSRVSARKEGTDEIAISFPNGGRQFAIQALRHHPFPGTFARSSPAKPAARLGRDEAIYVPQRQGLVAERVSRRDPVELSSRRALVDIGLPPCLVVLVRREGSDPSTFARGLDSLVREGSLD